MAFLVSIGLAAVLFYVLQTRIKEQAERIERLQDEVRWLRARLDRLEAPAPVEAAPAPEPVPETVVAAAPAPAVLNVPEASVPSPLPPPAPPEDLQAPAALPVPAAAPPPVRKVSLEELLGARLLVWIASIALAFAGAFTVKLSFDYGWFSPTVRVVIGVLFGVILLGAGEWMRRPSERIAQGLSAAGVADLYACFLAGIHLYGIIQPGVGFGLMALTTIVAVALSLRQGVMVALIGMIGGFLTPYLVRTGEPDVRGLFAYLLLLQIGLLTVARRRGWPAIGALALAGGIFWTLAWVLGSFRADDAIPLGLFLVLSVLATLIVGLAGVPREAEARSLGAAWVAVPGGLLAMALVAGRGGYEPAEWGLFGLIAAGTLVLARLRPLFRPLAWVAAATGAVLLGSWGLDDLGDADIGRFLITAAALGLLFAGGAYAAAWKDERPGHWGALSAASGLAFFLIAYAATESKVAIPWAAVALGIAALYLVAALPVARRRPAMDGLLAALAVAVTSFVSLAIPIQLERQWLTVGWAVEVAALVWLGGKFRLPPLGALARVLAIGVTIRLLLNASVLDYPIGDHPLFHWLWFGYGVPVLAFAAAAYLARRRIGDEGFATLLEAGALAFAFALATLAVRQLYHPGKLAAGTIGLEEWGALIVAWVVLALGLLLVNRRWLPLLPSLEWGGQIGLVVGAALMIMGPLGFDNPLWASEPVGETLIFNLLLWVYGVPAVLFGLAAAELGKRESQLAPVLAVLTVVLAFALVSLEVRQAFQGSLLNGPTTSIVERWSYSMAWIVFGAVLLVLGVTRRGKMLRYASLAVMLLVIAKVFLYDMANLSDLWRVFSFLGLGVSLLALAWVYQRFVFREDGLR
ncbi:MAG TPA: DUF2339 domain-containing protein [Thermoanaerobaculia bacterium]|nr:DUF2339 domain-containing protein [Thermoanaerobaculia bacterium]